MVYIFYASQCIVLAVRMQADCTDDWCIVSLFYCTVVDNVTSSAINMPVFSVQLFSIIVFGCISSQAWYGHSCQMQDSGACSYGTGIGVLAFLLCIGFLISDAFFDNLSGVQHRKYAVMADMAISGQRLLCVCVLTYMYM